MYTIASVTDDGENYFQKGLVSVIKSRISWLITAKLLLGL